MAQNMTKASSARLLAAILLGIITGIILGGVVPEVGVSLQFIGDLFLKALLVLVVPLVMASMIVGVTSLGDVRKLGGIGGRTVVYFLATTGIAVLIGLILVHGCLMHYLTRVSAPRVLTYPQLPRIRIYPTGIRGTRKADSSPFVQGNRPWPRT